MAAENVKVIIRCRPMNEREKQLGCKTVIKCNDCTIETWNPNDDTIYPKSFTFDSIYDQQSETENIYNDICYPLVESVLEGYNATIFVYGQTGCGKSYTMEGNHQNKGIISRAFEHIFETISITPKTKYLALITYLEIYNEQIRDLLSQTQTTLSLKESTTDGISVQGLTTHTVLNIKDCERHLDVGKQNRQIAKTMMNATSSRSHTILTIYLEQMNDDNQLIKKSKLNLVDLAGSERQTKTGAIGERLREATKINLSLSALGNVISGLVDGKARHIPYRDSKLTRLLQDSLGGNTRTLMIACINPSINDYSETITTLRYANRAKNIKNLPKINEDPKDAILREYREEIQTLRHLLDQQTIPNDERHLLLDRYKREMAELKLMHENEKMEKELILKQITTIREDYEKNLEKFHITSKNSDKSQIIKRINEIKAAMIGGERVDDNELNERRRRQKMAAQKRAVIIANILAKIDMDSDRIILQNQYKTINDELTYKTDMIMKLKHRQKILQKDIQDIQTEFEYERQDYLDTIRRQEKQLMLWRQIGGKLAGNLRKECNYYDLDAIEKSAIWLEDAQKYHLPDLIVHKIKLPPPPSIGRLHDTQTAPGRLNSDDVNDNGNGSAISDSENPPDIITTYFDTPMRRANELLNQKSTIITPSIDRFAYDTWRGWNFSDFTLKRNRRRYSNEYEKKTYKLEALPDIRNTKKTTTNRMESL